MFRWEDSSGIGRGGALGARAPPKFSKVPFFWWQSALLTTLTISLRSKIFFNFGKNYHMSEQNFIIFEKNYDISGKMLLFSENIIFSENIF
jgi:hypothetical protein